LLHSALTKIRVTGSTVRGLPSADSTAGVCQPIDDAERRQLLRFQRIDVLIALGSAGAINLAMLLVATALVVLGLGLRITQSLGAI